jgi:hypothetical protein
MSTFLDLVKNTYSLLKEEETPETPKAPEREETPSPIDVSNKEDSKLPKEEDVALKVQLITLAKTALFIDKSRLEDSNPSARTIINELAQLNPIDLTNVSQAQKLLEELIALVEIPS